MHTSSVRLQDTKTPLLASIVANFVNLGLDLFLMFGLGWGVAGAAIATSVSQYISFAILYWKMRTSQMLYASHVRDVPSRENVTPFLKVRWLLTLQPPLHPCSFNSTASRSMGKPGS